MTTKTKKTETQDDLLVHWCASGAVQVSSSDHTKWYDITVDRNGQLRCSCRDNTYRPWRACKHIARAIVVLEEQPATPAQAAWEKLSRGDGERVLYRYVPDPDAVDEVEPEPAWWSDPDALPPLPPEPLMEA